MSDIVKRLKVYNEDWRTRASSAKEVAEAIARIEQLEAALRERNVIIRTMMKIARAALDQSSPPKASD